jgi:hypothetical protein
MHRKEVQTPVTFAEIHSQARLLERIVNRAAKRLELFGVARARRGAISLPASGDSLHEPVNYSSSVTHGFVECLRIDSSPSVITILSRNGYESMNQKQVYV